MKLIYKICINNRINRGLVLLLLLIFSLITPTKGQQPIYSEGKDFWLAFLENCGSPALLTAKVYITCEYNTTGTISIPLQGWTQAFSVSANQGTIIEVPKALAYSANSEIIEQKGIHIIADTNISVWAVDYAGASADGTNVLPTVTIGETPEYIAASYFGMQPSEFIVASIEDNTEISITPSVNTIKGKPANVPFNITLNKGETYQVQAQDTSDLTGSSVKAITGSFAMFSGVSCTDIPHGCKLADILYKQCYPIKSWCEEYILTPFMYQTKGYLYRVIASEDSTTVTIPGQTPILLNKGSIFTGDDTTATAIYVSADKPISVVQYMKGNACNGWGGWGDPSMLILNSNSQIQEERVFESATTPLIIDYYEFINIITKTVNCASIVLDGKTINDTNFTKVPSLSTYSYAILEIDSGIHTISSAGGFIAYAYGVGSAVSYIYSIGGGGQCSTTCATVAIIKQPANADACNTGSASFSVTATGDATISYQWQVSPGWTNLTNNTMYSGVNTPTLTVTNPTATLEYRCIASNCSPVTYATSNPATLTLITSVAINPSFHNQSQCIGDTVKFTLDATSGTVPYSYQWLLNGSPVTDGSGGTTSLYFNDSISASDGGTYSCIISNACNTVTGNIVSLTPIKCVRFRHKITGFVTYDNSAKTPMSSKTAFTTTNVYLYNAGDTLIDKVQTDDNGYYEFVNIPNAIYYVSGSTKKAWGGSNPTDALIVNRNYIGKYNFTDSLWWHAGDVDSNKLLNPTDALIINRRYIGLIQKYPKVGDWKFEKIRVDMAGADISQPIKAECSGDVNGSYAPNLIPGKMIYTPVSISGSMNISTGKLFEIPVYLNELGVGSRELGALGLKFKVQSLKFKVLDVISNIEGLIYNITDDGVNIAWAAEGVDRNLRPTGITPDMPLFKLKAIYTGIQNPEPLQLSPESEIADINVNALGNDDIFMPKLILNNTASSSFHFFNYPNPFNNVTNIEYIIPEDLNVKLNVYNVIGEKVITLVNGYQLAGQYTVKFDGSNLKQGIYYCRIEATNSTSAYTKTDIMMIVR